MKAMVQDKYGSAEVLELSDIGKPEIGGDEVLVRVRAAGVNPADWAIMSGLPYIARPVYGMRKPKNRVRGTDLAGQVAAVGTSVTRFRPGDEVFGWCVGAYAEYASVSEGALARCNRRDTGRRAACYCPRRPLRADPPDLAPRQRIQLIWPRSARQRRSTDRESTMKAIVQDRYGSSEGGHDLSLSVGR